MSISHYPFDYDALHKGMTIPGEVLERIVQVDQSHKDYQLKILGIKEKIESEMRARDRIWTVCIIGCSIRILEDEEAAAYNAKQFSMGARKLFRSHVRNLHVDITKLTPEQKEKHERSLVVNGSIVSAIRSIRRKELTTTHQRQTPGLPPPIE